MCTSFTQTASKKQNNTMERKLKMRPKISACSTVNMGSLCSGTKLARINSSPSTGDQFLVAPPPHETRKYYKVTRSLFSKGKIKTCVGITRTHFLPSSDKDRIIYTYLSSSVIPYLRSLFLVLSVFG